MAVFQSAYLCNVDVNEETQQITEFYYLNTRAATATGDFTDGGTVNVVYSITADFEYIGTVAGGWIGQSVNSGEYRFFTNDPTLPTAPVSYSTADFVVCFLAGTRIAIPGGEAAIETLQVGDLVLTADGRAEPVRWVGVQSVAAAFANPLRSFPVRICAGALGRGLPMRDLFVSPDHALMLDGLLVQAGALVNGTTIVRVADMPERFTYYHLELADHALVVAEGVAAETFVDNVTRSRFDNYAEFLALYGDEAVRIGEIGAPRVKSARQLPSALRERLGLDARLAA